MAVCMVQSNRLYEIKKGSGRNDRRLSLLLYLITFYFTGMFLRSCTVVDSDQKYFSMIFEFFQSLRIIFLFHLQDCARCTFVPF